MTRTVAAIAGMLLPESVMKSCDGHKVDTLIFDPDRSGAMVTMADPFFMERIRVTSGTAEKAWQGMQARIKIRNAGFMENFSSHTVVLK